MDFDAHLLNVHGIENNLYTLEELKTFRTVTFRNRQRFAPPTAAPSYLPTSRRRRAGGGAELPTYFPLLTEGSYLARKRTERSMRR